MDLINSETKYLFSILGANNIRFVGGCVRDYLLNKVINDIDLATTHTPEKIKDITKENHDIKIIDSGIRFGTITLILNNNHYQITTLRRDISCDGRRADVLFSSDWQEDALRRDFTINALYMDISGKIYDYFDGRDDLKNGVVRFIGQPIDRIREDYLRILRFVRFSLFYSNDNIDKKSFWACSQLSDCVAHLSKERIRGELFKILTYKNSFNSFDFLKKIRVLYVIFNKDFEIDIFKNQSKYLDNAIVKLAILFRDKNRVDIKIALEKITVSKKELSELFLIITCFQKLKSANYMDLKEQIKFIIYEFGNEITLKALQIVSCENTDQLENINKIEQYIKCYKITKLPVNGHDFIDIGIQKGSDIKRLLDISQRIWIENDQNISKNEIISQSVSEID